MDCQFVKEIKDSLMLHFKNTKCETQKEACVIALNIIKKKETEWKNKKKECSVVITP